MRVRSTLLLALAVGAFAAYYHLEHRAPPAPPSARALVPGLRPEVVTHLEIERAADEASSTLKRDDPDSPWRIVEPIEDQADALVIARMLSALALAVGREAPATLGASEAGLDPPAATLRIGGANLQAPVTIEVSAPVGRRAYARVGAGGPILEVEPGLAEGLGLPLDALREKRLFTVEPAYVERVRLARVKGARLELVFAREGPFWRLESPVTGYADAPAVEALLQEAVQLRALRFVEDRPENLERFELAPPLAIVTLQEARLDQTVELGAKVEGLLESIYARRGDARAVVATSDHVTHRIQWDVERWRSRRVLHIQPSTVTRLEVEVPAADGRAALHARVERAGERWRFEQPAAALAQASEVDRLLTALCELRFERTVDEPRDLANFGLERPLAVTLATRQRETRLEIGSRTAIGRYIRVVGGSGNAAAAAPIYDCAIPFVDVIEEVWPAMRDRQLFAIARGQIALARIEVQGQRVTQLARLPEGGYSTPGASLDARRLEGFLATVERLTAERVLGTPDDLAHAGLAQPWLSIELDVERAAGEVERVRIAVGRQTPHGDAYRAQLTTADGDPLYFALDQATVSVLEADLRAATQGDGAGSDAHAPGDDEPAPGPAGPSAPPSDEQGRSTTPGERAVEPRSSAPLREAA